MITRALFALLALTAALRPAAAHQFHAINIPSEYSRLYSPVANPTDVSPDGSRVGGTISQTGVSIDCALRRTLPFTWTAAGGTDVATWRTSIPANPTGYPVSTWPEEVVGVTNSRTLANGNQGQSILFQPAGPTLIDPTNSAEWFNATAIADDASVVIGSRANAIIDWQPFRWTAATGVTPIDILRTNGNAIDVSGDGRVVVGTSYSPDNMDLQAFRWSPTEGVWFLNPLQQGGQTIPAAVSHDGAVIVGAASTPDGHRAFRWTGYRGTEPLPLPEGYSASTATDISADGQRAVGALQVSGDQFGSLIPSPTAIDIQSGNPPATAGRYRAMLWDFDHGTRVLQDVLANDFGLASQLSGWTLVSATSMSADGQTIAGLGVNPAVHLEGWVVTPGALGSVPEPSTLLLAASVLAFFPHRRLRRRPNV